MNLLPQALTGCNVWLTWILFLSLFIGILGYVEAFTADFGANIEQICNFYNGPHDPKVVNMKSHEVLTKIINLHAEVTR